MQLILEKNIVSNKAFSALIAVFSFVILITLGAFVRIPLPFTPVPLTLQTFFVLLSGACLSGRKAGFSSAIYIVLGLMGAPIFSGAGSGLLYILGPTGGYIIGFVLASVIIGGLVNSVKRFRSLIYMFLLADLAILACGAAWLNIVHRYPLPAAFSAGFLPFVYGDMLKAVIAAFVYHRISARCREIF